MLAVQEVMGRSGLTTILRQAGLLRYASSLPPDNHDTAITTAEYAAMIQAIENYYGRGARGSLNRIGHAAFDQFLLSRRWQAGWYGLTFKFLPIQTRKHMALRFLADQLASPGQQIRVQREGRRLALLDYDGDACFGRTRDAEVCWEMLGEIQAALKWATGRDHDVTETACKAKGDAACRFDVGETLAIDSD
jgi:hypothetical protein